VSVYMFVRVRAHMRGSVPVDVWVCVCLLFPP
jgi:hypothetical protein